MTLGKCLAPNVPFTDKQRKQLEETPKDDRPDLIQKWRAEYAKNNMEGLAKDVIQIGEETGNLSKEEMKALRNEYKKVLKKNVAPKYINDAEYMKKAIAEYTNN